MGQQTANIDRRELQEGERHRTEAQAGECFDTPQLHRELTSSSPLGRVAASSQ